MTPFLDALLLQAGYNAALVAVGAALLGCAAGASGAFLYLRKRALISDAVAHATLPGVVLAFMLMAALGGDGRSALGLMAGSAATAWIGLLVIGWITRRTRLSEDTAIGAVLGVFFGLGVVLLTVVQTMSAGRQAGLESFLLGSTAGMLFEDAVVIAIGGSIAMLVTWVLRRPLTLVAFDSGYAASLGYDVRRIDLQMMGLVLAVTVIGLKLVGLILIVAMLIIPPVTARFWTERSGRVVWIAAAFGAASGYGGAALSASAPNLPTGPIIVLVAAGFFTASLLCAPGRGVLAAVLRHRRFQQRVHLRQGLLALAAQHPIREAYTIRLLARLGLVRKDGVATAEGRARAAKVARDERRWDIARDLHIASGVAGRYDGLTPIEDVFTADEIAEFDRRLGPPAAAGGP
ncbi:MAG: metal ABC transporter permease [Pseudomonadota bacterium]